MDMRVTSALLFAGVGITAQLRAGAVGSELTDGKEPPPPQPMTLSPGAGPPGTQVTFTDPNCDPASSGTVQLVEESSATSVATASFTGQSGAIVVPGGATRGRYQVVDSCGSSAAFTVTGPPTAGPPPPVTAVPQVTG